jgi:hypothetical protein
MATGLCCFPPAINAAPNHVEGNLSAAGTVNAYEMHIGATRNLKVTDRDSRRLWRASSGY